MRYGRFAATLILMTLCGCGTRSEPEPFTIGHVVSLSGPRKVFGIQARNGAGLAVEVAQRGGQRILGRRIVVRHVDDRGDPELVQAEAVRLVTLNRCFALLGGPDAVACERLARVIPGYGTPLLLPADLVELPAGESVFCLNAAPAMRGEGLARFVKRNLPVHRVVALADAGAGAGAAMVAAFSKSWRQEHHEAEKDAVKELSCPKESEWGNATAQLVAAKPDAVVLSIDEEAFPRLRTRLLAAGLKVPLFFVGEDRGVDWLMDAIKDGPPVYLVTAFTSRGDLSADGQGFVRQYEETFGNPPDLAAALAYDGVRIVIEALTRAQVVQPPRLTAELVAATEFPGVTGPVSLADRRAKRKLYVVAIQAGEAKVVGTFGPEFE
jgi:branched-chain amino acid transport system substrate-binding protein